MKKVFDFKKIKKNSSFNKRGFSEIKFKIKGKSLNQNTKILVAIETKNVGRPNIDYLLKKQQSKKKQREKVVLLY